MPDQKEAQGIDARGVILDALALSGVGLVTYGAWLIYEPAGFIVPGLLFLLATVAGARGKRG